MNKIHNSKLGKNARSLRKNMTKEERHLWYDCLKNFPVMVHRQKVIGKYIVDFYIASAQIVIEIDGTQHYEDSGKQYDAARDAYLESLGCTILRYSNADIHLRFEFVCADIYNKVTTSEKSLLLEEKVAEP